MNSLINKVKTYEITNKLKKIKLLIRHKIYTFMLFFQQTPVSYSISNGFKR